MLNKVASLFKKEENVKKNRQIEFLENQLRELQEELEMKYQNFDNAEKKYIDVAVNEINLIREKHSIVFKELRELVS